MKIIVLGGAGEMGSRCVRELARSPDVLVVGIADRAVERARKLARVVAEETGADKGRTVPLDAANQGALVEAVSRYDVVASALGPFYRFEEKAVRAAIEARLNYVSICDDYDAAAAALDLDDEAARRGVSALTGLGWTPGLTNMAARLGANRLGSAEEVRVYWAGSSRDSRGFAVILHTMHIFTGKVPTFLGGKQVFVRAGSDAETVEFPAPVGRVVVRHLGHPEPLTIPKFMPGVRTVTLKGGLTEPFLNLLAVLFASAGFTRTPVRRQALARMMKPMLPALEKMGPRGPAISAFRVDVSGRAGGRRAALSFQAASQMETLTGVPLAVGALMLGRGQVARTGVFAPEAEGSVDPELFWQEVASRGVRLVETEATG